VVEEALPSGQGVDSSGGPVIDPTANVYALVRAESRRQDDLREKNQAHMREILAERDAREREVIAHAKEIRNLETQHAKEMRVQEAERINAVRTVDVQASQQQAADAETRAATLAKTVTDSAEALRNQVIQSQVAATAYVNTSLEPLKKDVAEVRQWQFEQQGRGSANVETKQDQRADSSSTWLVIGVIATAAVASFASLISLAGLILLLIRG